MWTLIILHSLTVYLILLVKSQQFCLKSFKNWIVFNVCGTSSWTVSCGQLMLRHMTWMRSHDRLDQALWIKPTLGERERVVPAAEQNRSTRTQEWHLIQCESGSDIRIRWVMNIIRLSDPVEFTLFWSSDERTSVGYRCMWRFKQFFIHKGYNFCDAHRDPCPGF